MEDLKILEATLLKAKSPISRYLNPGIREEAALVYLQEMGLDSIPEILGLYAWHNGVSVEGSHVVTGFFGLTGCFIPMELIQESYQSRVNPAWVISNDFSGKYLLPISYDNDLLVCLKPDSRFLGAVYIVSPALLIVEPLMIFDSIRAMVAGITECHRQRVYCYDAEGNFLSFDTEKETKVLRRYNPNSEFWKREEMI